MSTSRSKNDEIIKKRKLHFGRQKGWGCDLYAIAAVSQRLYEENDLSTQPLPARKRDTQSSDSLRQQAKKILEKRQSALYSIDFIKKPSELIALAESHPEVGAEFKKIEGCEEYIAYIINAVNRGLYPIIFYDSGDDHQPKKFEGHHEHVAVVIDYYVDKPLFGKETLQFVLQDASPEPYAVNAEQLYYSTEQLKDGIEEIPFQKVYYKKRGAWYPSSRIHEFFDHPEIVNETKPTLRRSHFLRNGVLLIYPNHAGSMLMLLKQQIQLHFSQVRLSSEDPKIAAVMALRILERSLEEKQPYHLKDVYLIVNAWQEQILFNFGKYYKYKALSNLLEITNLANISLVSENKFVLRAEVKPDSALNLAIQEGDQKKINQLLSKKSILTDAVNVNKPILISIDILLKHAQTKSLKDKLKKFFLKHGITDKLSGFTPLHMAACLGHAEIVKKLIMAGADPSMRTQDSITALDFAKEFGDDAILNLLAPKDPVDKIKLELLMAMNKEIDTLKLKEDTLLNYKKIKFFQAMREDFYGNLNFNHVPSLVSFRENYIFPTKDPDHFINKVDKQSHAFFFFSINQVEKNSSLALIEKIKVFIAMEYQKTKKMKESRLPPESFKLEPDEHLEFSLPKSTNDQLSVKLHKKG